MKIPKVSILYIAFLRLRRVKEVLAVDVERHARMKARIGVGARQPAHSALLPHLRAGHCNHHAIVCAQICRQAESR